MQDPLQGKAIDNCVSIEPVGITSVRDEPELNTTEHWRGSMRRARLEKGLSQRQLATKVGGSQNLISGLESGKVGSSKRILRICDALGIPPPQMLFLDDSERRWVEVGRAIRAMSPEVYESHMETLAALAKRGSGKGED